MSKSFSALKPALLELEDKIPLGMFKGCRIIDIVSEDYDYLIWAEKTGLFKYSKRTIRKIQEMARFEDEERHYEEEVRPYIDDLIKDLPF